MHQMLQVPSPVTAPEAPPAPQYGQGVLLSMLYVLGWTLVAAVAFAIIVPVAMRIFNRVTPGIDELAELRDGNVAVAIVMAAMVIGFVVLVLGIVR